jgi:hypothetical protein
LPISPEYSNSNYLFILYLTGVFISCFTSTRPIASPIQPIPPSLFCPFFSAPGPYHLSPPPFRLPLVPRSRQRPQLNPFFVRAPLRPPGTAIPGRPKPSHPICQGEPTSQGDPLPSSLVSETPSPLPPTTTTPTLPRLPRRALSCLLLALLV